MRAAQGPFFESRSRASRAAFAAAWTARAACRSPAALPGNRVEDCLYGAAQYAAQAHASLAEVIATLDSAQVFELLSRHDVPVAPMVEPSQVAALPQFAERHKFEPGALLPIARYPVSITGVHAGGLSNAPILDSFRQ